MLHKHISYALVVLASYMIFPMGISYALTAPVAQNDSYTVAGNGILDISGKGILANDTSNGKTLSAFIVTDVRNGTLLLNVNGSFVYVPDLNFHGVDSFRYVAGDGSTISNVAIVTINVTSINQSPIARNDLYTMDENSTLVIHGIGLLANDTDPNRKQLQSILVSNPLHGILALNQNGSFSYVANSGFHGTDVFTYKASNGLAVSNVATVTITVNQPSTPPTGNPILILLAQIQDLISRITGIENKITTLEHQNAMLDDRVNQLEQVVKKMNDSSGGTSNGQGSNQDNQENDNHDDNSDHEQEKDHEKGD